MRAHVAYASLGREVSLAPLVARWIGGLPSLPGEPLVLEAGHDGAGDYLEVWGPSELIASFEGPEAAAVRRLPGSERARGPLPSDPTFAPGRVVWTGLSGRGAAPGPVPFAPELGNWGVQGLFQANPGGAFAAHVRVAASGSLPESEGTRDRVGLRWAAALGGLYESWRPGSPAARAAAREWNARIVRRFHSGERLLPGLGQLAVPWAAPPVVPALRGPPPSWRLGWPWSGAFTGTASHRDLLRHVGVLGMTGSGKTQYLVHLATESLRQGVPFVLFDLHGDLGPAVLSRLEPSARERVVVLDGSRPWGAGHAGVDVLSSSGDEGREDLAVAEVLSALRPAGGTEEEFWGPRLKRILGSALRAAWETGGDLEDVAALVHDPVGHAEEMARGTRRPHLRSFLEGLVALHRRQPDYLASSQNRLSLLVLSRVVASLLAPRGRSIGWPEAVEEGRSLVVHLPKGTMGEGPSLFVANLLLSRLFVGLLTEEGIGVERVRCLVLLDEMQNFSVPLVRSLLETGRKFGVATVFATQSVERLEGALGPSLLATVGTMCFLRTPPPSAAHAVALVAGGGRPTPERDGLEATLASLPDHVALVRAHGTAGWSFAMLPRPAPFDPRPWVEASDRSAREFGGPEQEEEGTGGDDREVLLQAAVDEARSHAKGRPAEAGSSAREPDRDRSSPARAEALRRGWLEDGEDGGCRVTPSGWARLGLREESGAPRESEEHRRLVREAFRLFARNGVRLEIPLQGRFDLRLPDARARQVPGLEGTALSPAAMIDRIAACRGSWLWRLGHGLDVHVEAEVSSLRDPRRLHRSLAKARRAEAYLLFLTGTSRGGRTLRTFLANEGWGGDRAGVWVLPPRVPADGGAP